MNIKTPYKNEMNKITLLELSSLCNLVRKIVISISYPQQPCDIIIFMAGL